MRQVVVLMVVAALVGGLAGCSIPVVGRGCIGMPDPVCQTQLADAERTSPLGSEGIVGIQVRCSVASCTEASGEASITISYGDGRTASFGTGWAMAAPAPVGVPAPQTPMPVEPVCVGVPVGWCRDMAVGADGMGDGTQRVASIVISCTAICNEEMGDGTTVVTFMDGTKREAQWNYRTATPASTP
jgi:hypothetical protein